MPAPIGNKFAQGLENSGRPPLYNSPEDMQSAIDAYFKYCEGEYKEIEVTEPVPAGGEGKTRTKLDEFGDPITKRKWIREPETITITGLALYMGFASRKSLLDYEYRKEGHEEFAATVVRARLRVEQDYEKRLNRDKVNGVTFALQNMGWTATNRHEVSAPDGKPLFADKSNADLEQILAEKLKKLQ